MKDELLSTECLLGLQPVFFFRLWQSLRLQRKMEKIQKSNHYMSRKIFSLTLKTPRKSESNINEQDVNGYFHRLPDFKATKDCSDNLV
ncbi:hypothetical protein Y1Q_0017205 [Alligator mississippiensis]|uniref:Uncharacterized protein n=1 Tax=Alligator mississippiensis TaxID=8496 RepID=A0A151NKP4_ALLMI|nr:hypothetical protein Y1Q_0017205 [Alligator mississippiensis]